MKIETVTFSCDICKAPPENLNVRLQVIFTTEQTEGRSCEPHLANGALDLCDRCYSTVLQGNYIFASGAQGINNYYFNPKYFKVHTE